MSEVLNPSFKKPVPCISDLFQKVGNDAFLIKSDIIITKNQILIKNNIYLILDFLDLGEMHFTHIKLLHTFTKEFMLFIIGVDIKSGGIIKRIHRLDTELMPSEFVIIDLDFFEKEINENNTLE